eukprot:718543-Amphidinium_carterae.1
MCATTLAQERTKGCSVVRPALCELELHPTLSDCFDLVRFLFWVVVWSGEGDNLAGYEPNVQATAVANNLLQQHHQLFLTVNVPEQQAAQPVPVVVNPEPMEGVMSFMEDQIRQSHDRE